MRKVLALILAMVMMLVLSGTARAALVAWWPFDELGGTTAGDLSGSANQHNATLMNGASFSPGQGAFGGAMWLDGINANQQFAEAADHADLEFLADEDFTVSLWYKRDGVEDNQGLITKGYQTGTRNPAGYWQIQTYECAGPVNGFAFDSRKGSDDTPRTRIEDTSGTNHGDNQWHHFVVVRDMTGPANGQIRLYVDNSATPTIHNIAGFETGEWAMGVHDDPVVIGNHHNRYTEGYFDDVAIWKGEALSAADINTIYNSGVEGLLLAADLVWDGVSDGDWRNPHATLPGKFRWDEGATPADHYPGMGGSVDNATINNYVVTVSANDENANRLAVNAGPQPTGLKIVTGGDLHVATQVNFAAGTSLEMQGTSSLTADGGGEIDSLLTSGGGTTTVSVGGPMDVTLLDAQSAPAGTFVKAGPGPLTTQAISNATNITLKVSDGTFEIVGGLAGFGGATSLELGGGRMLISVPPTPSAGHQGAIGYWPFDNAGDPYQNEGTDPANHDGTAIGTQIAIIPGGRLGQGLQLNTTTPGSPDSAVDVGNYNPNAAAADRGLNFHDDDWTMAAWMRTTHTGGGNDNKGTIFANGGDTGGGFRYATIVSEQNEGRVSNVIDDNNGAPGSSYDKEQFSHSATVNDGDWHFVVTSRDGDRLRTYIDGAEESMGIDADYDLEGIEQLPANIGASWDWNDPDPSTRYKFFRGEIDEVRLYNSAISASEVLTLMGVVPLDLSTHAVKGTGVSTLEVTGATSATVGGLTMYDGSEVTIAGVPMTFNQTFIDAAANAVGFRPQQATDLDGTTGMDGDPGTTGTGTFAVVTNYGPNDLTLDQNATNMGNATFTTDGGGWTFLGTNAKAADPTGGAKLAVANGNEIVLSAAAGAGSPLLYDNAVEAGTGTLRASSAAGTPFTIQVGSPAKAAGTSVAAGDTLDLVSDSGVTLEMRGNITGDGKIRMQDADSQVVLSGPNSSIAQMTVTDGVVSTAGNEVEITDTLVLGEVPLGEITYTIDPAHTFTAKGTDLLGRADITVSAGSLEVSVNTGLLSYWSFDAVNAGAPVVADDSGNSHDLAVVGAAGAVIQPGQYGNAIYFNDNPPQTTAATEYAVDDDAENYLNGLDELTVVMWIKADDIGADGIDRGFWTCDVRNRDQDRFGVRYDSTGANGDGNEVMKAGLTFDTSTSIDGDNYESGEDVQTTAWQQVAVTWEDGMGFKMYIDTALDTPTEDRMATTGKLDQVQYFRIGDGAKAGWDGLIDEVYLFDRALGQAGITQLYNNQFTLFPDIEAPTTNLVITGNATITSPAAAVGLGDLTMNAGVTQLILSNSAFSFNNVTSGTAVQMDGEWSLGGNLNPGDTAKGGIGTLTFDTGHPTEKWVEFGSAAEVNIDIGLTNDNIVLPQGSLDLDGELNLNVTGDILPAAAKRPYGAQTRTIIEATGADLSTIVGQFAVEPSIGDHLARGIFVDLLGGGVVTTNASLKVDLYQAQKGDANGDHVIDTGDMMLVFGNWTLLPPPDNVPRDWPEGNFSFFPPEDANTTIETGDMMEVFGNWTLKDAGDAKDGDPQIADLLYYPATGEVELDPSEAAGEVITIFRLMNDPGEPDFNAPGVANFPWPLPDFLAVDTPLEIANTDLSGSGISDVWSLGAIFPTGLDQDQLEAFLTVATYVGSRGTGVHRLDLIVIPEPGTVVMLLGVVGGLLLLAIRRRRRA